MFSTVRRLIPPQTRQVSSASPSASAYESASGSRPASQPPRRIAQYETSARLASSTSRPVRSAAIAGVRVSGKAGDREGGRDRALPIAGHGRDQPLPLPP